MKERLILDNVNGDKENKKTGYGKFWHFIYKNKNLLDFLKGLVIVQDYFVGFLEMK